MKPRQHSTFRRSSSLLIAVSFAMSLSAAHATSLTWDGNGATEPNPDGGAGTWDMNTTANWWDGASNVMWPDAGTDNDAVFANTAGTVSLAAGGVTANDLTFSTTGYLLQGDTLTLNGATPTITTDPGVSAAIDSTISGSAGLVKTGSGTLTLDAANNYSGATTINAGTLQVSSAAALPTGTAVNLTTAGAKLSLGSPGPALAWVAGSAVAQAVFGPGYVAAYAIDGNLATRWSGGPGSWIYADLGSSQSIGQFKINWEASRSTSFVIQTSDDASNWTNASGTLSSSAANVWETYSLNAGASGRYVRMFSSATVFGTGGESIWEMQALSIASGTGTYTLGSLSGVAGTVVDLLGIGSTLKAGSDNSDTAFAGSLLGGAADSFVKEGTGTLTWVGTVNYLVAPTVSAGTLKVDLSGLSGAGAGGLVLPGSNLKVEADGILQLHTGTNTGADSTSFSYGAITGSGTITKTGTGYLGLILSVGVKDFAGLIDIQQGILGNNGPGWAAGAGLMDLNIAPDALFDMRTGNVKIDALGGAGTIEKTWFGNLDLSLGNNDGSATFSGTIDQTVGGGGGNIALTKTGSGTQTLSGANNYAGVTTINGGTLALTGSATLASPTITVASSATLALADAATVAATTITLAEGARLDTSGLTADLTLASGQNLSAGRTSGFAEDIKGNLAVGNGSLHIAGTGSTAATLTQTGKLTLGGSILKFDLGATDTLGDGVNDLIAVTGDLALVDSTSITINKLSGTLSAGSYTLISWTGTLSGTVVDNLSLNFPSAGRQSYGLAQSGNSVVLNVTGLPAELVWTGADYTHPTYWDLNTTANWSGIADGKFADGDKVAFNDSATATTVDIQGYLTPESVTFSNTTAKAYTISGPGGIDGATTGITKNGDGVVTIASDNSYAGPTILNTGTINVNSASALGTGTLVINGGVLDNTSGAPLTLTANNAQTWNSNVVFTGSNDLNLGSGAVALTASGDVSVTAGNLTVGGVISGTGPLTKSGAGTLTFGKTNTYSGGTTINAGTLRLDLTSGGTKSNLGAFGSGTPGNLELLSGSNTVADTTGLDGNAKFTGTGTLTKTGTGYVGLFFDGSASNEGVKNFAGLIDIQQGILGNNSPGWGSGPGAMDLNIAAGAFFDMRTQNVKIDTLSGAGTIEKTWGGNLNLSIGNNDGSATFSGTIDQTVGGGDSNISLTKNGSGTQTLSNANNYGGGTIVTAGTLAVSNTTGSGTGSGAVTVQTTATLAGTGSVSGNVSVETGGFVAPGNAGIGTLTVASAALTGAYQCQLDVASGDQVVVTGALTVNPGAAIAVSTLGSPAAASYIIATYGTLGGGVPTVTGIPSGYVLDTATTGQIKLVKSAGGFSDWADSWLGLTDKTPGGDPDGDGISNVMEYVIGGDPRVSSTSYLPGEAIVGTDLVLSYERSDASEADTTQTGQWSTDLTDWNDIAPVLVNENDADPDSMEIRIPLTNAVGGKLFGRLNVIKP